MIYHSQNNEAEIILEYFGSFTGTLLSIGECDGVTFSNAYDLIIRGLDAVLVEPNKAMYDNIPTRDGVRKFNFGIGQTGLQKFYISSDGLLSSVNKGNVKREGAKVTPVDVQFYSYADALNKFPVQQFDYITIDAEGMDWQILQQIDLTDVRCLCIEYASHEYDIIAYCLKYGLQLLHRNHENLILVR